jgi:hypothetical protein
MAALLRLAETKITPAKGLPTQTFTEKMFTDKDVYRQRCSDNDTPGLCAKFPGAGSILPGSIEFARARAAASFQG